MFKASSHYHGTFWHFLLVKYIVLASSEPRLLINNYQLILKTYGEAKACMMFFFFNLIAEISVSFQQCRELSVYNFSSDTKFSITVKGWIMSGNQ